MKLLAIDTSTNFASVVLKTGDEIFSESWADQKKQAQRILPVIDDLILQAGMDFRELDGIIFGKGPGSFTGLRIACSIAKGLAYANNIQLYPVSTLLSIVQEVRNQNIATMPILSILDARMQEWYWSYLKPGAWEASEQVGASDTVDIPEAPFILAGFGFEEGLELLPENIRQQCIQILNIQPKAFNMIQLVEADLIQPVSAENAQPTYIRNSVIQGAPPPISGDNRG